MSSINLSESTFNLLYSGQILHAEYDFYFRLGISRIWSKSGAEGKFCVLHHERIKCGDANHSDIADAMWDAKLCLNCKGRIESGRKCCFRKVII